MARPEKHDYTEMDRLVDEGATAYEVAMKFGVNVQTYGAHRRKLKQEKTPPVTEYQLEGQEVHMVGKYVGVVWNTPITNSTRLDCSNGKPYIIFCSIVEIDKGELEKSGDFSTRYTQAEESPVDGGFSAEMAHQLIEELRRAIQYIKKQSSSGQKDKGNDSGK